MSHPLFDRHRARLDQAREAIRARTYWSAFPEIPSGKVYGEAARDDGARDFQKRLGQSFELEQPGTVGWIGAETSPYGLPLNVRYPQVDLDPLLRAMQAAIPAWRDAGCEARTGVCLEILQRLNQRSFELANAVMHTTGQGFMMAFQAGGPHAQDRGLEAVAYAYEEMSRTPQRVSWSKPVSKTEQVTLEKQYALIPRGIALTIGCSTFPTWNAYPGLFASLATGNAVLVKPHPGAILPLALTVETARAVLREEGFDPNLVCLAADTPAAPLTRALATRPEIRIIDYTGSSEFGDWIEQNARQAIVFTEKAGVNSAILDSVRDLKAVMGNLAFSLCLYSGQMCTTPQNIFIPRGGLRVGDSTVSFDEAAAALAQAVDQLLAEPARAAEVLGAIQSEQTLARIDQARREGGAVLRDAAAVPNEAFPQARVRSPLLLKVSATDQHLYMREMFGPIGYVIATADTSESIALACRAAETRGALTASVYSTDPAVLDHATQALTTAGVALSCNLVGPIYVNQAAAYSDFHVSGGNPSGNATLCDAAFVANRFRVVQSRRLAPQGAGA